MTNTLLTIAAVIIFIVGPFWLIYIMDKRVAKKSGLFTGQATKEASFFSQNRLASFGKLLVVILTLSAIFICIVLWVAKNPNNLFSWIFIIGIVLFVVFARIFRWFNFLRNLFK